MRAAQRFAVVSSFVRTDCVDATEFPELASRFRVRAVPKSVINDRVEMVGSGPDEELLRRVLEAVSAAS